MADSSMARAIFPTLYDRYRILTTYSNPPVRYTPGIGTSLEEKVDALSRSASYTRDKVRSSVNLGGKCRFDQFTALAGKRDYYQYHGGVCAIAL